MSNLDQCADETARGHPYCGDVIAQPIVLVKAQIDQRQTAEQLVMGSTKG